MTHHVSGTLKRAAIVTLGALVLASCSVISAQETSDSASLSQEPNLGSSDRKIAQKSLQNALENSVSGKPVRWQNPASGASGSVTPLKTWQTARGKYCRAYREKIKFPTGQSLNRRGTACRSPNAVWTSA